MKKKQLLALAMLAGVSMGSLAEKHYLIKDGALVEGVTQLEAGEDDFLSDGKSPAGDAAVLLTHVKQWSDARLYTENPVSLATHSKLVIEYYFDKLDMGNFDGKYPAITFAFGQDTIGGKFTRDAAAHSVTSIDVKFKHLGQEGKLMSDTAFIYCHPDMAANNKFFTISYDRELAPNDNVLYIKNIYLLDEVRPLFAENFEANTPAYMDKGNAERYVVSKGEVSLQTDYSSGAAGDVIALKNSFFKSGVAISTIDPDGNAFEETRFGTSYNKTFNASLLRRWEMFGSDVNTGTVVDNSPVFTDPITVSPNAFYDTEIYHSLSVSKSLATVNGSYGFLNLPLYKAAEDNSKLIVSFLAKWSASEGEDLEIEENKSFPVFIKFDNSDDMFQVSEENMTAAWTIYNGDVAIPAGAKTFDIIISPNANFSYNIDNLQVALDKVPYFFTMDNGSGLDVGDVIAVNTNPNVASIEADADVNATAYFDGDNFIVKADEEIASISIIDMAGKTASVNGGEFNVSGFNKGIYVFVAKTVNGVSISGKIIIE